MEVKVNGNTITVPDGASVSVINNQVFVNGTSYSPDLSTRELRVIVDGSVHKLSVAQGSVTVNGHVTDSVECAGSFTGTSVGGDVDAGGSVRHG